MADASDLNIDRNSDPTTSGRRLRWLIAVAVVVGAAVGLLAVKFAASGDDDVDRAGEPQRHVESAVGSGDEHLLNTVASRDGGEVTAGGYLEIVPPGLHSVSAAVDGRIASVEVVAGDRVEEGEIMARIEAGPLDLEIAVLRAELQAAEARLRRFEAGFRRQDIDQARADLRRARTRLDLAEAEYERTEDIVSSEAAPARRLQEATADRRRAEAEFDAARAELDRLNAGYRIEDIEAARAERDAARARLDRAEWEREATVVRAPTSGVVFESFVQPGDWILRRGSAGDEHSHGSGALFTVGDPTHLQAWVDVNQRDIDRLREGDTVELIADSRPDKPFEGRIRRILPVANLQRNTVEVKIELLETREDLRPEMAVRIYVRD